MILKAMSIAAVICCFFLIVPMAYAHETMKEHFNAGCEKWGTPPSLAMAIANVESGFHPWAINIQGKSHYMDSRESALTLLRRTSAQRKSYDVGIMQINSYWLRRLKLDPADILDPRINILIGCWILSEELKRYGMTWKAIGAYHTPVDKNPIRARAYADKVFRAWEDYK